MDGPCQNMNGGALIAFIIVTVLTHARGMLLLWREAALVLGRFARGVMRRRRSDAFLASTPYTTYPGKLGGRCPRCGKRIGAP